MQIFSSFIVTDISFNTLKKWFSDWEGKYEMSETKMMI